MNPTTLSSALRDTVQVLPDAKKDNGAGANGFWSDTLERGALLPAWGTRRREWWLRWYDRHNYNTLWQGAAAGLVKKFVATPHEIKGGRNLTNYLDDLTRYADFANGFGSFKAKWARDYLRFDGGSWFEIIAPGSVLRAPTGRVVGLANLDSYACMPTGDPNYPGVYSDRDGKLHLMHRARINHMVDMPDSDQNHPGYGLCALSRAIAVVERQLLQNRYIVTSLDDKPPPGMLLVGGMTREAWNARWAQYQQEQGTDVRPEWGRVVTFHGADASLTPTITPVTFSTPPQNFDFKVYVELDVHEFALAIGVDIQELWELTGGNMGSSGQSQIQHAKSQGKTYGEMLSSFERAMNNYVLPTSLEFEFKVRDPYEANERATNAQTWAGFVSSAGDSLTPNEKRQILANQVEAVADAILDEEGKLIRLPDSDPQAPDQQGQDVTVDDAAPTTDTPTEEQVTAEDSTPNAQQRKDFDALKAAWVAEMMGHPDTPPEAQAIIQAWLADGRKDFDATRTQFVTDVSDLMRAGRDDELTRRRAGTVMRAQLSRLGRAAYEDGLKAGGIEDGMDSSDQAAFALWLAEQSGYVTPFLDSLYTDGLSDAQISAHSEMWANKSLTDAYQRGLARADADGLYEWQLGETEHCTSCLAMKGQKHRLSEYQAKGIVPNASILACGGYNCRCSIVKSAGKSAGNWLN